MSNAILAEDGKLYDAETGEALTNEVEQVEVEIIEDKLPSIVCNGGTHIQTNTEQLKKELVLHLKKYDIEVTEETEKEASKAATELNKLAKDLNSKRLSVGKEIKKPADLLKKSIDELIELVQTKRASIIEGVEVFKSKRFEWIRGLLKQERDRLFEELEVGEEYRFLDIEILVKETSLRKSNLTKVAKDGLLSMVRGIKTLEDTVTIRTLKLQVICIDAGLQFAIELNEVQNIIKEDDYDAQLKIMIDARLGMELKVKEAAEAQAARDKKLLEDEAIRREKQKEDELKQKIADSEREKDEAIAKIQREADEREQFRLDEIARKEQELIDEENEKIAVENKLRLDREEQEKRAGKRQIEITAKFNLEVDLNLSDDKIFEMFKKKLGEFKSLTSLSIQ